MRNFTVLMNHFASFKKKMVYIFKHYYRLTQFSGTAHNLTLMLTAKAFFISWRNRVFLFTLQSVNARRTLTARATWFAMGVTVAPVVRCYLTLSFTNNVQCMSLNAYQSVWFAEVHPIIVAGCEHCPPGATCDPTTGACIKGRKDLPQKSRQISGLASRQHEAKLCSAFSVPIPHTL